MKSSVARTLLSAKCIQTKHCGTELLSTKPVSGHAPDYIQLNRP